MYCGTALFEQFNSSGESDKSAQTTSISFQKRHRNMQLLLLKYGSVSQAKPKCKTLTFFFSK